MPKMTGLSPADRSQLPARRGLRVLLYSHDSWGLGHLRRSLAIAGGITERFDTADALIVSGSPCATQFQLPARCDVVKLPAVTKASDGQYVPRSLSGPLSATLELRQRILLETFRAYCPDLVIVDHQVVGLYGEALDLLREARSRGVHTIYGLRDIIDLPETVARAWDTPECRWALRDGYDRICVYGQQRVYDPVTEYPQLREVASKLSFTGYVVNEQRSVRRRPVPACRPEVLVSFGGGEDGQQRLDCYLKALALAPAPWDSRIITGPLMASDQVKKYKQAARKLEPLGSVQIHRFYADIPKLLDEADAAVCMAGYNTCAEILQSHCPAVLLPRTFPRREQALRAARLADLGAAISIEEPTPESVRAAVQATLDQADRTRHDIDLGGLDGVCNVIGELIGYPTDRLQGLAGPVAL